MKVSCPSAETVNKTPSLYFLHLTTPPLLPKELLIVNFNNADKKKIQTNEAGTAQLHTDLPVKFINEGNTGYTVTLHLPINCQCLALLKKQS